MIALFGERVRHLVRRIPAVRWLARRVRRAAYLQQVLPARWTYQRHPRRYWTLRGRTYFAEEAHLRGPGSPSEEQERYLTDWLRRLSPSSVLEVGCGYGRLLRAVGDRLRIRRLVGVDFSATQLVRARHYASAAQVALADAECLPFRDGEFDLVYTAGVMMHVPPALDVPVRRELLRVASRHVVHLEDQATYEHAWARDHAAPYRRWSCPVLADEPVPCTLEPGQHLRLVVVALEPSAHAAARGAARESSA